MISVAGKLRTTPWDYYTAVANNDVDKAPLLAVGQIITGTNVLAGTRITALGTVTGGGSAFAIVCYNGASWTVMGI